MSNSNKPTLCPVCGEIYSGAVRSGIAGTTFVHERTLHRGRALVIVEEAGCQILPDGEKIKYLSNGARQLESGTILR